MYKDLVLQPLLKAFSGKRYSDPLSQRCHLGISSLDGTTQPLLPGATQKEVPDYGSQDSCIWNQGEQRAGDNSRLCSDQELNRGESTRFWAAGSSGQGVSTR